MRHRVFRYLAILVTSILMLSGLAPVAFSSSLTQPPEDNEWTNETYDFTIGWSDSWTVDANEVSSVGSDSDVLSLTNGDSSLVLRGEAAGLDPADRLDQELGQIVFLDGAEPDITIDSDDVATAEVRSEASSRLISVIVTESGDANVIVTLVAATADFDDAIASAAADITLDDAPLLASASDTEDDPTEEATEAPTREATEEPTEEADETPDLKLPTREPMGDGVDGDTYTSPNFGYSFEWDSGDWDVAEDGEVSEDGYDLLSLTGDNGGLNIYAFEDYDGDPGDCLESEADFVSSEAGIEDWEPAENADGDPIADETSDSAYAVYTLNYTDPDNESGPSRSLANYLECRDIGDGAVLIIFAISARNRYNDHIDQVIDVTDTITLADQEREPEATETPEDDEAGDDDLDLDGGDDEPDDQEAPPRGDDNDTVPVSTEEDAGASGTPGDTAIDGSVFTSPGFGFTLDIPTTWSVEDEQIEDGSEQLVLSNGTSTVTVWASSDYDGENLANCVTFASEASGLDLELDVRDDGSPFLGADDLSAYGAYVYENGDTGQTYFIKCSWIEPEESVLIILQDVPTEDYATERRARRQIENSIDLP